MLGNLSSGNSASNVDPITCEITPVVAIFSLRCFHLNSIESKSRKSITNRFLPQSHRDSENLTETHPKNSLFNLCENLCVSVTLWQKPFIHQKPYFIASTPPISSDNSPVICDCRARL